MLDVSWASLKHEVCTAGELRVLNATYEVVLLVYVFRGSWKLP
jgi:hypothetical protein